MSPVRPTADERREAGTRRSGPTSRAPCTRSGTSPNATDDPVAVLEQQAAHAGRRSSCPVRYERMAESPFAFYRGAAAVMAMDLSTTPVTGLTVQACGDAHVANFGTFATPERNVVFDINDFDETDPGPWEWDVKRLAASLHVVALQHGFRAPQARPRRARPRCACTASTSTSTPGCARSTSGTTARPPPISSRTSRASTARRRSATSPEHCARTTSAPWRGSRPTTGECRGSSRTRRSWCTSSRTGADMDDVGGDGRRLPVVPQRRAALPVRPLPAGRRRPAGGRRRQRRDPVLGVPVRGDRRRRRSTASCSR